MPVSAHLPGYRWFHVFRYAGVRTGVYCGVALSLVFCVWIFLANRVPFLEPYALARNVAAAAVMAILGLIPIIRSMRSPGVLLASSLISWSLFSITYLVLCMYFSGLSDRWSGLLVFVVGAVVYLILATLFWIGSCIWKVRASDITHHNHHLS